MATPDNDNRREDLEAQEAEPFIDEEAGAQQTPVYACVFSCVPRQLMGRYSPILIDSRCCSIVGLHDQFILCRGTR